MPLNCKRGDWHRFIRRYRRNDRQWYLIPKAKTYDEGSVRLLIDGLTILRDWLCEPECLAGEARKYLQNYLQEPQQSSLGDQPLAVKWGSPAQVLFASRLFKDGIISREQQDEDLKSRFDEIIEAVERGKNYYQIERRFGRELLIERFSANSRNFINIYQKLGLAWIEKDHLVTVTSVGRRIIENGADYRPLLEHQLRRLQFYNPAFERGRSRYGHIKVFPFNFCLQVIVGLSPHVITKEEFALFVTKAVSMGDVGKCLDWIKEFRLLNDEQRSDIIKELAKPQKGRARPLITESLETASKNINFLTLSGPWNRDAIGTSEGIVLRDIKKAEAVVTEDRVQQFVEFESREAWFGQYGDISRKFDIESAIDYYARIGKFGKAKELTKKVEDVEEVTRKLQQKLMEKHVEDFYRDHLELIEAGLNLYSEGKRTGQQFETPDGGIIDLLTLSADNSFVVIEFKRDKTSDEAIGQVLRYMGWVRKHLSPGKAVRGYIVAFAFDKYVTYALYGMQHPLIPNPEGKDLIQLYTHAIDASRMGTVSLDAIED
jgi:hypothetical protein